MWRFLLAIIFVATLSACSVTIDPKTEEEQQGNQNEYRKNEQIKRTKERRPDLLESRWFYG